MNHLTAEQLLDAFYDGARKHETEHLNGCGECRAQLEKLSRSLSLMNQYVVPDRPVDYGEEVWHRLNPLLFEKPERKIWKYVWLVAPALAAMLVLSFLAGRWAEHRRINMADKSRERVLLLTLSDHLEQSQIVLAELLHAEPGTGEIPGERERARNLLEENRLLRQTAAQLGDRMHAALLDDLERVLVDLANSPSDLSSDDLKTLQERIERNGLLWKLHITRANTREEGQKL